MYLTEEEADALRHAAEATGRSQSDIIRQGIRQVVTVAGAERTFRSMAHGHGGGRACKSWDPDDLYREVMGKRP